MTYDARTASEPEIRIPRYATDRMMDAGLYYAKDLTWADVFTIWHSMFDAFTVDGGTTEWLPPNLTPTPTSGGASEPSPLSEQLDLAGVGRAPCSAAEDGSDAMGEVDLLDWLSGRRDLELYFHGPIYGDDDDQSEEWRIDHVNGSINDRERTIIGRGETPRIAIAAALSRLTPEHRKDGAA